MKLWVQNMTLVDNSLRIGRQRPYFSNMRRKKNGMWDYINTLDGREMWEKYVTYTHKFEQLHSEIKDMKRQLAYNRTSKLFCRSVSKHDYYLVNLCRYYDDSYRWGVFQKLQWTINKYEEYLNAK